MRINMKMTELTKISTDISNEDAHIAVVKYTDTYGLYFLTEENQSVDMSIETSIRIECSLKQLKKIAADIEEKIKDLE
jgi:hypothetical protein